MTALVMTATAGFVDAMGYLFLAHIFVANMSGNSVGLGLNAARLNWREVARRGFPIAMFSIGLLVGGAIAEGRRGRGEARAVTPILVLEAMLLACFLFVAVASSGWHEHATRSIGPATKSVLIALAAVAMGVQNVGLRAGGALSVYTTHVTGTITQLSDTLVRFLFRHWHKRRQQSDGESAGQLPSHPNDRAEPSAGEILFLLSIWIVYVVGAAAGAVAMNRFGSAASLAPLMVIVVLLIGRLLA
jgi:uncharacterized membrane protein YoaK (UPF0700 family)